MNLPFNVVLACDPFANGCTLFQEFTHCPTILSGAPALLDHARGSGVTSQLMGYIIHSHCYTSHKPTSCFWELQASIVTQLCLIHLLAIVVAFVHPDHNGRAVSLGFVSRLRRDGWLFSNSAIHYPNYGDSVTGSCCLLVGVHSNTKATCAPIEFKMPPACHPCWISLYGHHSIVLSMPYPTPVTTHRSASTP